MGRDGPCEVQSAASAEESAAEQALTSLRLRTRHPVEAWGTIEPGFLQGRANGMSNRESFVGIDVTKGWLDVRG
jgi:hypothetical protein